MKYTENAINILATKTYKGIGRAWIVKNLHDNKNIETIISLLNKDAKVDYHITINDFEKKKNNIKNIIEQSEKFIDGIVAIGDKDFPSYRGNVNNSEQPIFLFYKGNLDLLKTANNNIAVIGLLNPDENIKKIEKKVVTELVENNITIVSGLALGCDAIAHEKTLELNGKTIAILPSPLNNIMPTTNKELAKRIIQKNGLLITEYLTDAKSRMELGGRYQERDRLQALFSNSIILSASYAKNNQGNDSGSRLAMGYALKYSIPRAIIYNEINDIGNTMYDLNRQIINESDDIIVIDMNNLKSSIQSLLLRKPKLNMYKNHQANLFN